MRNTWAILAMAALLVAVSTANGAVITGTSVSTISSTTYLNLSDASTFDWIIPGASSMYSNAMAAGDGSRVGLLTLARNHNWGESPATPVLLSWSNGVTSGGTDGGGGYANTSNQANSSTLSYGGWPLSHGNVNSYYNSMAQDQQYNAGYDVNFTLPSTGTFTLSVLESVAPANHIWGLPFVSATAGGVTTPASITEGVWQIVTFTITGNAGDAGTVSIRDNANGGTASIGYAQLQSAPEPATMALLAVGGIGVLLRRRTR